MQELVGRDAEKKELLEALETPYSELIVVYGRRRIGKTFLIRQVYKDLFSFEYSGVYQIPLRNQLNKFRIVLSEYTGTKEKRPLGWIEAFHRLGKYLDRLPSGKKKVIFLDEFPWLDTRKSYFLAAFDDFWNDYATKRSDLVVVVCGSSAGYMVKNIIHNRGGLHNRITRSIRLRPFNLRETEFMLKRQGNKYTRYDLLHLYMTLGGVPHYLEQVKRGESVAQAVDRLCFSPNGFLRTEFSNVFASLFDNFDNHLAIVKTLAKVRKGLKRSELMHKSKVKSGGTLTKTLRELEESGFIEKYYPYQGRKDALYRLSDEYSMFYLKFVEGSKPGRDIWAKLERKQSYRIWAGFTFETICIKHIEQIKAALGISGIYTTHGSWVERNVKNGIQIDLLIDRADNVVNLCEMKFHKYPFVINKKYAEEMQEKIRVFQERSRTSKSIFVTFITSNGLKKNPYSLQLVQNHFDMNVLFTAL